MNWCIGQPIVAIRNHDKGRFKKGDEFTINGLKKSFCKCGGVNIDIGFAANSTNIKCNKCNVIQHLSDNINWMHERSFAPLDQDISELTEILNQKVTL